MLEIRERAVDSKLSVSHLWLKGGFPGVWGSRELGSNELGYKEDGREKMHHFLRGPDKGEF